MPWRYHVSLPVNCWRSFSVSVFVLVMAFPLRGSWVADATLPVGETGGSKGKEAPNAKRRGSARGAPCLRGYVRMRRFVFGCLARARGGAPENLATSVLTCFGLL